MQSQQGSTPVTEVATASVQNILSILSQSLGNASTDNSQAQSSGQRPSMDQEMSRCFPGFFRRGSKRTSVRFNTPAKVAKQWNPFNFTVFLLHKNCDSTPTPVQDLQHMQAGLGKRTLCMPKDMTHLEVSSLFKSTYPKMKTSTGGWLLYKAAGGNGRRHLSVVSPESEGYTGSTIRSASGSGKTILYIVPLQEEFDLTPLPYDAQEFSLMPKAECKNCFKSMPLQLLALHVNQCKAQESDTLSDSEPEPSEGKCPICQKEYPTVELELHASVCGDWMSNLDRPVSCLEGNPAELKQPENEEFSCKEDVLQWLAAQVDTCKEFCICVSRINLLQRGLTLWQRQKHSSPVNPLKVTFIGEPGVDTGALRKEFLTEMISGIKTRLFEGEDGKGKMPKYSLNDLDSGLFRVAGELFAASLAQGGPAPKFLQEWCYNFLLTGNLDNITKDDINDLEFSSLIKMVEETTDLSSCTEQILNCGYTGPIDEDNRQKITRAILLHSAARRTVMLRQLREGLQLYGLIGVMERNREICRELFVAGDDDKVDSYYIVSHLAPTMSESGTQKHVKEAQILNNFQDFLQELEDGTTEDEDPLSVPQVLQWLTGQSHRHLLLSERENFKIVVHFDHTCIERMPSHTICYPLVSACTHTITFPTAHFVQYYEFKENIATAIKCGAGFYRI
ncbi:uncharacterized protein LOC143512215 isoform X2 [Brachyhypopomus gauderio]|uniref:uncharacterized protein LOC143512215 isoform X2 n=1 Tax=Brachyhypopomus gauderio TaxID=698409 RepID=UPI004042EF91